MAIPSQDKFDTMRYLYYAPTPRTVSTNRNHPTAEDHPATRQHVLVDGDNTGILLVLVNSLQAMQIDVNQFVCFDQCFDPGPDSTQKHMKISFAHIAKTEVDDSGRWTGDDNTIRKVGIFGDNDEIVGLCILPDLCIRETLA